MHIEHMFYFYSTYDKSVIRTWRSQSKLSFEKELLYSKNIKNGFSRRTRDVLLFFHIIYTEEDSITIIWSIFSITYFYTRNGNKIAFI